MRLLFLIWKQPKAGVAPLVLDDWVSLRQTFGVTPPASAPLPLKLTTFNYSTLTTFRAVEGQHDGSVRNFYLPSGIDVTLRGALRAHNGHDKAWSLFLP